jgi:hypothetical protein
VVPESLVGADVGGGHVKAPTDAAALSRRGSSFSQAAQSAMSYLKGEARGVRDGWRPCFVERPSPPTSLYPHPPATQHMYAHSPPPWSECVCALVGTHRVCRPGRERTP